MRPIPHNRKVLELTRHEKFFTKTTKQKFHIENTSLLPTAIEFLLAVTFTKSVGQKNAENIILNKIEFEFETLPEKFNGTKLLFLSDLHIDAIDSLAEKIISISEKLQYDFCILGGDYRFRVRGNTALAGRKLENLVQRLSEKTQIFGILGNHDEYCIAEHLEGLGVKMLINESVSLENGQDEIYLVGLDDCHYYAAHNLEQAESNIPAGAFKIMLCHSPEFYKEASRSNYPLYIAGHTHGGQLCLPGGVAMIRGASIRRKMIKGKWNHRQMKGYTSVGAGVSCVPVRFFCPPEVALITLKKTIKEYTNNVTH